MDYRYRFATTDSIERWRQRFFLGNHPIIPRLAISSNYFANHKKIKQELKKIRSILYKTQTTERWFLV